MARTIKKNRSNNTKVLNLPSIKLPIKPLTHRDIDRDIKSRVSRIDVEFTNGFNFIRAISQSVTFFGSARLPKKDPYYKKAERLGKRIAAMGYSVVTGGGPGIMEAANRGAFKQNQNRSVGLTIRLPREQVVNPYIHNYFEFYYFFTRKVCLTFSAEAYVYFPGGFGTLDEFFEILTLVQTNKIVKVPIILVGKDFWQPLDEFIKKTLAEKFKTIHGKDRNLYIITDDEDKIIDIVSKAPIKQW